MKKPKLKLVWSQQYSHRELADLALDRAQRACARDDWEKAIGFYKEALSLIGEAEEHRSARGEVHVYIAHCYLLERYLYDAENEMVLGYTMMDDNERRAELKEAYCKLLRKIEREDY